MDGLSIPEETGYPFQSVHEGHMHACGHDLHMTIALGIIDHFVHQPIKEDLLFIFQPAEEGPGGAEPMLTSDVLKSGRQTLLQRCILHLNIQSARLQQSRDYYLLIRVSL